MKRGKILLKVLNISKHEVGRILEAWFIRLCYHIAFVIGWTMLTAMVVNEFGIANLPLLYISNGLLMILGSFVYAKVLVYLKHKILIVLSVLLSSITLFLSAIFLAHDGVLFIISALATLSFFTGQLYILLLGFIEELFSPNENERANPIIETSEPIGGILGGIVLVVFAKLIPVYSFVYFWAGFLLALLPIMLFFYRKRNGVVRLVLERSEDEDGFLDKATLRRGFHHARTIPFVKGLAIVILCHWTFLTMLNFQYTKAVDANVQHGEVTHAVEEVHTSSLDSTPHGEDVHTAAPIEGYSGQAQHSDTHEEALTHGLGTLHIIFSALMLLVQLLFSSRVVERLGVVRSMEVLPGVSLLASVGMFLNFGFATAVIAKGAFEMFLVIYNNAYHNSYYAISEKLREQIREFLEGMVRPVGVVLGTLLIIAYQFGVPFALVDNAIIISMVAIVIIMIALLMHMRGRYTMLVKRNADLHGDQEEKFTAIEVLSQRGHIDASDILTKNLLFKKESPKAKIKILSSLARLRDVNALPEILECVEDDDEGVQVAALKALGSYKNLGEKFYTQAFAKFRVVNTLTHLFETSISKKVKSEIVRVFAKIHHGDVVDFLLEMLEREEDDMKADIIEIIGMFNDINAAHYIEKYLSSTYPMVKANTIIALWQFKKYRLKLLVHLLSLLDDIHDKQQLIAGIHVLGEVKAVQEIGRLRELMENDDEDIRMSSLLALAKMGEADVVDAIVEILIGGDKERALQLREELSHVDSYVAKTVFASLENKIYERIVEKYGHRRALELSKLAMEDISELQHYFYLVQHEKNLVKLDKCMTGSA